METAADPHLEPGVLPVLGCQDAGAAQPGRVLHRFAAVQPLSAGAGREGRAGCGDLVKSRAHLHRSAHIGEGTVIRKDSFINGYQAHAGFIHVGAITIGKNAVISEATVIDIDTSMGDGTQLGHASSLHSGQTCPTANTGTVARARRP